MTIFRVEVETYFELNYIDLSEECEHRTEGPSNNSLIHLQDIHRIK